MDTIIGNDKSTKALVFGNFYPFHKGHEALIQFALENCTTLTVCVCASDKELISGEIRQNWIQEQFKNHPRIEVYLFNYKEEELTNSSEASTVVSKEWAEVFKQLFPTVNLIVTSEAYGDMVAQAMHIRHLLFDINRTMYPISGTEIRNQIQENWEFLPMSVKRYFTTRVVILGTESTGKTTLTKKLADHFNCPAVLEAGRDIIADSKAFEFSDLEKVVDEHYKRIANVDSSLIIIDTDIHITKSYAEFVFNKELKINNVNDGNTIYLYLNNDVPFVQDGTRLNETERNALDISHRNVLSRHNINFIEISGDWETRRFSAINEIEKFLKNGNTI